MELFKSVNIDWMGKAKYFIACSLILLTVGWVSVLWNHGLCYGIDFRGGPLVVVRFSTAPPIDQIRKGLQDAGLRNSTITPISDISDPNSKNDVQISLETNVQGPAAIDVGAQAGIVASRKPLVCC